MRAVRLKPIDHNLILLTCNYAIEWIDSLIDAHCTKYNAGTCKHEVHDSFKAIVAKWKKQKREILRLQQFMTGQKGGGGE